MLGFAPFRELQLNGRLSNRPIKECSQQDAHTVRMVIYSFKLDYFQGILQSKHLLFADNAHTQIHKGGLIVSKQTGDAASVEGGFINRVDKALLKRSFAF